MGLLNLILPLTVKYLVLVFLMFFKKCVVLYIAEKLFKDLKGAKGSCCGPTKLLILAFAL